MLARFAIPEHDRRLIPEGRVNGPMPWMIAIMVLLTILAAAVGIALNSGAHSVAATMASKATVQIIEPNERLRNEQKRAAIARLETIRQVRAITPVPDNQARALLEPWLGQGGLTNDIPVPSLIDIEFDAPPDAALLDSVRAQLRDVAPATRLDSQTRLIEPIAALMRWMVWLALGVVLLLVFTTSATVVLAARSALNSHRMTIDTVHLLGGTDRQIARLFQRRIALDTLFGATIGFAAGIALILLFGTQINRLRSALFESADLPWFGWAALALVPLATVGLASLVARLTIVRSIRKIL